MIVKAESKIVDCKIIEMVGSTYIGRYADGPSTKLIGVSYAIEGPGDYANPGAYLIVASDDFTKPVLVDIAEDVEFGDFLTAGRGEDAGNAVVAKQGEMSIGRAEYSGKKGSRVQVRVKIQRA